MRRREFVRLLGGGAEAVGPLLARAQEAARNYRVGGLTPSPRDSPHYVALFDELRRLGFIEGQNLRIDGRGYGVRNDQFVEIAVELAKTGIDAFFCAGDAATRAAQRASTTIPIIAITDDMVGSGLVRSLANPGGNTTGVSILATELDGKRQDILMEAVPFRSAEVGPATDAAKNSGAVALNVLSSPLLYANRRIIIERAAALRLPAMYQWPEIADEGGFLAYGPRLIQVFREMVARQLVKVLRGAKPADMPIEQPTRFEFVINLRTGRAIGHDVPAGLVLRADKVIE
jgi:ABC-type uncharacterized transport system substrate-binding protein